MNVNDPRTPPGWARDLVVYQVNPRAFTSPDGSGDGSGSGTFASMAERFNYLRDLGVNGIWMAGHHLATDHFYGIWSVYAVLDPATLDPSLGSPDDLRAMVDAAHAADIRIFLDVLAHGVLHESPVKAEHPDWFPTSSWGMADYDYTNPEFRAWWIDLWVNYALDYDIDGYRIDVSMCDITVWDQIVTRLAQQGKEIVVFPENERYHFSQQDHLGVQAYPVREIRVQDYLGTARGLSAAQISCHDYGWEALPGNHYYLKGSRARAAHGALLGPYIPIMFSGDEFDAVPTSLPNLTQGLFGTGGPGGWLYGNQLDWSQLSQPRQTAMHRDIRNMLSLRRRFPRCLHGNSGQVAIAALPHDGTTAYVPYALGEAGVEAILVLANDAEHEVVTQIRLNRADLGFDDTQDLTLVDAITGEQLAIGAADTVQVEIPADRTPGGGYRALHLYKS